MCLALLLLLAKPARAAQACSELATLTIPGATITRAELVSAGTFTPPAGKPIPDLPGFCRVAGISKPSSDSNIQFEVWMPSSGWNGKLRGIGNGGFAGSISYDQLGASVAHGYAAAASDTGHQGEATDGSWALGHPQRITDFGYRAIHETTVDAKIVTRAFYGDNPRRSYFSSCSNGGRQALQEAQRYPADYDGIIAGAPANYWTHLLASAAWDAQVLSGDKASYISADKLQAIETAALAACDELDGVKDHVIENPTRCHYDVSTLLCKGPETDSCLTATQVVALKKLYSGPHTSDAKEIFPGFAPGGEAEPGGWGLWITGPAPEHGLLYAFGTQFFKNMVFNDPNWDYRAFNIERDTKAADEKFAGILNATNPDLRAFNARGGKLIIYHGWSDAAIAPRNTIDYYDTVTAKLGLNETRRFVRLFMVPGMQHCAGGSGANSFGQFNADIADPRRDMNTALERWVEQGIAPDQIIAAKRKSDFDSKSEVIRTHPLCAWPLEARYSGSGSPDDAANFTCGKP